MLILFIYYVSVFQWVSSLVTPKLKILYSLFLKTKSYFRF